MTTSAERQLAERVVLLEQALNARIDNPPPDLDYTGDAMDIHIPASGHVVSFRRHGEVITFGVTPGSVLPLNAEQAEFIARQLFAAAEAAKLTERERSHGG